MIPVIRMQDIVNQFPDRTGHQLLGEEQGCVNGCNCGVSYQRRKEYGGVTQHDDQEGFFVLEGRGKALVGGEEIDLEPGICFVVPAHTDHVMKVAEGCDVCKVFWFHAAI